jgi:hypothetical protein
MPEFLMAEGDMVVVRETYRLKHTGEFQGIPLTGKEVSVTGCLGYFAYLLQNLEGNDHAGNLITICLKHEWRRKGADSVIRGALFGTDVSSSQYRPRV